MKNKKIFGFILVIIAIVIGAIFLHLRLIEKDKKEFNAKFEAYAGTNIQGTQVNKLIQEVSQVKNGELLITFPSSDGETQTMLVKDGTITYGDSTLTNKVCEDEKYKVRNCLFFR